MSCFMDYHYLITFSSFFCFKHFGRCTLCPGFVFKYCVEHYNRIFTARIRKMLEGTVFSLLVHTSTRGVLHLADGGRGVSPFQVWTGGGYPIPGLDEGGYSILLMGE